MKIFTPLNPQISHNCRIYRLIGALLGGFFCFNALAVNWQSMGLREQGIFYIDRDSISSPDAAHKHIRQVWSMLDYRDPQKNALGKTYRSTRSLIEVDCDNNRSKTLSLSLHAGAKLTGEVLTSEGVIAPWQPIPPDTPLVHIKKAICDR
jgi:hypothetical protein